MEINAENITKLADSLIDFAANIAAIRQILVDSGIVDDASFENLFQLKREEMLRDYQNHD